MMRENKRRILIAATSAVAVTALLAACSSSSGGSGSSSGKTITIGSTLVLTGPDAAYGKLQLQGLELGLADAQKASKNGTKFNLISTDSQAEAGPAVTEGRKLMADDKVPMVVTGFSAPPLAQLGIAEQYSVPLMNGAGNTPDLEGHDWLFNNAFMVSQAGYAIMKYAYQKLGVKKIAVIIDSTYPEDTVAAYKKLWKEVSGGNATVEYIDQATTDATPNVEKALASKPDALLLSSNGNALSLVLNELTQQGVTIPILGNDGAILGSPQASTIKFPVYYANSTSVPSAKFLSEYKARFHSTPDFESLADYNLALVFGQVVAKLQAEGKPITGANVHKILDDAKNVYTVDGGAKLSYTDPGHISAQNADIVKFAGGTSTTIATGISTVHN